MFGLCRGNKMLDEGTSLISNTILGSLLELYCNRLQNPILIILIIKAPKLTMLGGLRPRLDALKLRALIMDLGSTVGVFYDYEKPPKLQIRSTQQSDVTLPLPTGTRKHCAGVDWVNCLLVAGEYASSLPLSMCACQGQPAEVKQDASQHGLLTAQRRNLSANQASSPIAP